MSKRRERTDQRKSNLPDFYQTRSKQTFYRAQEFLLLVDLEITDFVFQMHGQQYVVDWIDQSIRNHDWLSNADSTIECQLSGYIKQSRFSNTNIVYPTL